MTVQLAFPSDFPYLHAKSGRKIANDRGSTLPAVVRSFRGYETHPRALCRCAGREVGALASVVVPPSITPSNAASAPIDTPPTDPPSLTDSNVISWEQLDAWDEKGVWPESVKGDTLELCQLPAEDLRHEFKSLYLARAACPQNVCFKVRVEVPKFVSACLNADMNGEMIFGVADGRSSTELDLVRQRFGKDDTWMLRQGTILGCDISEACTQEYVRQNAFGQALADLFHPDVAVCAPARIELSFVPVEKSRPSSGRMLLRVKLRARAEDQEHDLPDFICSVAEYKRKNERGLTAVLQDTLEAIDPAALSSVAETKKRLRDFFRQHGGNKECSEMDKARLDDFIKSLFADPTKAGPVTASLLESEITEQIRKLGLEVKSEVSTSREVA